MTGKRRKDGTVDGEEPEGHDHVYAKVVDTTYSGNVRNVLRQCTCGKRTTEHDRISDAEVEALQRRGQYKTG